MLLARMYASVSLSWSRSYSTLSWFWRMYMRAFIMLCSSASSPSATSLSSCVLTFVTAAVMSAICLDTAVDMAFWKPSLSSRLASIGPMSIIDATSSASPTAPLLSPTTLVPHQTLWRPAPRLLSISHLYTHVHAIVLGSSDHTSS